MGRGNARSQAPETVKVLRNAQKIIIVHERHENHENHETINF